jgi:hypothetical protein
VTERREHIEGVRFNLSQKLYINDRFQVLTCRSLVASVGQELAGSPRLSTSMNRAPMVSVNGKLPAVSGRSYYPAVMWTQPDEYSSHLL